MPLADRAGRDADHVPLLQLDDVVVDLQPRAAAEDDVDLLLLRARQTAAAIARATGAEAEVDERLAPGATVNDLRDAVRGRGATVVVVGHQPDCGQIAAALTGGPEPAFKTAGMVELSLDE